MAATRLTTDEDKGDLFAQAETFTAIAHANPSTMYLVARAYVLACEDAAGKAAIDEMNAGSAPDVIRKLADWFLKHMRLRAADGTPPEAKA